MSKPIVTKEHELTSFQCTCYNTADKIEKYVEQGWEVINIQPFYEYGECTQTHVLLRRLKTK